MIDYACLPLIRSVHGPVSHLGASHLDKLLCEESAHWPVATRFLFLQMAFANMPLSFFTHSIETKIVLLMPLSLPST